MQAHPDPDQACQALKTIWKTGIEKWGQMERFNQSSLGMRPAFVLQEQNTRAPLQDQAILSLRHLEI